MTEYQEMLASNPEQALAYVRAYLAVMLDNKYLTSAKDYKLLIEHLMEYMDWRDK